MNCKNPKCNSELPLDALTTRKYCSTACRIEYIYTKAKESRKKNGCRITALKEEFIRTRKSDLPALQKNVETVLLQYSEDYPYSTANIGKLDVKGDWEKDELHKLLDKIERTIRKSNLVLS